MKKISALLFIACLSVCRLDAQTKADTNAVNPVAYPIGHGNKVVFVGDYYTDYLKLVKAGVNNMDSLYRHRIEYPMLNRYFAKGEYSDLARMMFYMSIRDTTGLSGRIATLNSNKEKIEKIITDALAACNKHLKNDSMTIYVQPFEGGFMSYVIKKMGGVSGFTAGGKSILLSIDPTVSNWSNMLAHALAHEYHHATWTVMNFKKQGLSDLLSDLVFEGRADSYANIIYPTIGAPWDTAISAKKQMDLWTKIKPSLKDTTGMMYYKVMFGDWQDYADYPMWGGYSLGFSIVQAALKANPKLSPEEWTNLTPEKILEMSGYK
jgi:uncharacterized protein YjaZ